MEDSEVRNRKKNKKQNVNTEDLKKNIEEKLNLKKSGRLRPEVKLKFVEIRKPFVLHFYLLLLFDDFPIAASLFLFIIL